MSGMTLGGMIEADRRLREYEGVVRRRKRVERDQLVWRKWEGLVEGSGVEGRDSCPTQRVSRSGAPVAGESS